MLLQVQESGLRAGEDVVLRQRLQHLQARDTAARELHDQLRPLMSRCSSDLSSAERAAVKAQQVEGERLQLLHGAQFEAL